MAAFDKYAVGWVSDCCGAKMTTRGGDGGPGSMCWAVCNACGERCDDKPVYAGPVSEFRADGWPLCPCCGEDELWTPVMPAVIQAIVGCLRCGWNPRPGDLGRA